VAKEPLQSSVDQVEKLHKTMAATSYAAATFTEKIVGFAGLFALSVGPLTKLLSLQEDLAKVKEREVDQQKTWRAEFEAGSTRVALLQDQLLELEKDLSAHRNQGNKAAVTRLADEVQGKKRDLLATQLQTKALKEQLDTFVSIDQKIRSSGRFATWIVGETAVVKLIQRTISDSNQFNKTLIQANSSLKVRRELLDTNLSVQLKTGASMADLASATEQLRQNALGYGKDLYPNLLIVDKLRQGIGLSVEASARLANEARNLHTPFLKLADTMATIQDKTAMTADQIGRLGDELYDILRGLGSEGNFDVALKSASALEQAMREAGASAGTAQEIIKSFSNISDKGGFALALGAKPGFIGNQEQTTQFIERVGRMLDPIYKEMKRGSIGAQFQFKAMAEQLGLTSRQAAELVDASKRLRSVQADMNQETKTLAQRFDEQKASTSEVWKQFGNTMLAFAEKTLRPITSVVAWLNEQVQKLMKFMHELDPSTKDTIKSIAKVVAVIGTTAAAFKGLAVVLGTLSKLVPILSVVLGNGSGGAAGNMLSKLSAAGPIQKVGVMVGGVIQKSLGTGLKPLADFLTVGRTGGMFAPLVTSLGSLTAAILPLVAVATLIYTVMAHMEANKNQAEIDKIYEETKSKPNAAAYGNVEGRENDTLYSQKLGYADTFAQLKQSAEMQLANIQRAAQNNSSAKSGAQIELFKQYQAGALERMQKVAVEQIGAELNRMSVIGGNVEKRNALQKEQAEMLAQLREISDKMSAGTDQAKKLHDQKAAQEKAQADADRQAKLLKLSEAPPAPTWAATSGRSMMF